MCLLSVEQWVAGLKGWTWHPEDPASVFVNQVFLLLFKFSFLG